MKRLLLLKIIPLILCFTLFSSCDSDKSELSEETISTVLSLEEDISNGLNGNNSHINEDSTQNETKITGIYKGVFNHAFLSADKKDSFLYVFEINGKEKTYGIKSSSSDSINGYYYQNLLKRGYKYNIQIENGIITNVEETETEDLDFTPIISGKAGEKTISNLISTALMPVGTALYIYGGGWDWQDVGSSTQAMSIGVSDDWVKFFNEQNNMFSYINSNDKTASYFPHGGWNEYYYAGLDCSGYIGWVIYNVMNEEDGKQGYVMSAGKMAKTFANKKWGTFSKKIGSTLLSAKGDILPGDIVSTSGHVWMCLGTCDDGSIVIAHSTPSVSRAGKEGGGVQIGAIGDSESCEAYILADHYMKTYFKKWYSRYPVSLKNFSEYTKFTQGDAGLFSWHINKNSVLSDPDNIRDMTAKEVLAFIFKDAKA